MGLLLAAVVVVSGALGCGFNTVVAADEEVKAAWSEVESQYQRRADLVPNLVATVKGAAGFEQATLTAIIDARANATSMRVDSSIIDDPQRLQRYEDAQQQLSASMSAMDLKGQ